MALVFTLFLTPLAAQSSSMPDLGAELATSIAARLAPGESVVLAAAEAGDEDALVRVGRALQARGVATVASGAGVVTVRITCFQNLRERGCAADLQRGSAHDAVAVTHPFDGAASRTESVAIDVQPIVSQREPILDVAATAERLVLLGVDRLTMYRRRDGEWQLAASQPVVRTGIWPRDVRGRVSVAGDGSIDVLLPGMHCTTTVAMRALTCVDERVAWPLDIPNGGLEARRNHFTTPEGLPFFDAASLGMTAGARWIVAALDGQLVFLDGNRKIAGTALAGDDVAAVAAACSPEPLVLVASTEGDGRDIIRAFAVSQRRLLPRAAPVEWRGQVTALWTDPSRDRATVVVRSAEGDRYDAFHIRFVCDR
jgi:hypothetical protein